MNKIKCPYCGEVLQKFYVIKEQYPVYIYDNKNHTQELLEIDDSNVSSVSCYYCGSIIVNKEIINRLIEE